MGGVEGFELSTSSSQSWRSTRLSYTPPISCLAPHARWRSFFLSRIAAMRLVSVPTKDACRHPSPDMARPERFELPPTKFVAWYSIQQSYAREEAELFRESAATS